jgi:hypothetical protein
MSGAPLNSGKKADISRIWFGQKAAKGTQLDFVEA